MATPHLLETEELRSLILSRIGTGNREPLNNPLQYLVVPALDPRFHEVARSGGKQAQWTIVDEWKRLNDGLDARVADLVHELFISGLIRWSTSNSSHTSFEVTRLGQQAIDRSPSDPREGLLTEVADVWDEAFASFRANRLKSAAIVVGVAAEMVIDRLAERIERAGRIDKNLATTNVLRPRRDACIEALKDRGWATAAGISAQDCSDALDGLQGMGVLYARVRNEQAHPKGVLAPQRDLLFGELMAFPAYARAIEAVLGS